MGKELHGKTIQQQTTGYLLPVALEACCALKQRLSISKICDVCLIENVLAMLKELKGKGAKVQSSVDTG